MALKKKSKTNSIFLKESEILTPILKNLDDKDYSKLKTYPLHNDINPENTLWKNKKLTGLIDFENASRTKEPFIRDISGMLLYSCRNKKYKYKPDINLFNFFLKEYRKYKEISKTEISFIPDIITALSIEDFSYVYWMLKHDLKRAKLYRLKLYSKTAQWYHKNKRKIIKALI